MGVLAYAVLGAGAGAGAGARAGTWFDDVPSCITDSRLQSRYMASALCPVSSFGEKGMHRILRFLAAAAVGQRDAASACIPDWWENFCCRGRPHRMGQRTCFGQVGELNQDTDIDLRP